MSHMSPRRNAERENSQHRQHAQADRNGLSLHESLSISIADNNPLELARALLMLRGTLKRSHGELVHSNVALVQQRLMQAYCLLEDPALFVIQTLIAVGAVVEVRSIERGLELAVSQVLVQSLGDYLNSPRQTEACSSPESDKASNNNNANGNDLSTVSATFSTGAWTEDSLIALEDNVECGNKADFTQDQEETRACICSLNTIASRQSLLDDDSGFLQINMMAVPLLPTLAPHQLDIPFAESVDTEIVTSSCPKLGAIALNTTATCNDRLENGLRNSKMDKAVAWPSPTLSSDRNYSSPIERFENEGTSSESVDDNSTADRLREEQRALVPTVVITYSPKTSGSDPDDTGISDEFLPIQQRHRRMLLEEIAASKSPLQVFATLEVYGMRQCLMRPLHTKKNKTTTYGIALANQLMEMDRLRECTIVVSKFLVVRDASLDLELLSRLLSIPEKNKHKLALVHEFVGEHLDTCIAVLQDIDIRLSMRLAQWTEDGIGDFIRSDMNLADMILPSSVPGKCFEGSEPPLPTPHACVSLIQIAMSLIIRFRLEDSQDQYASVVFFSRYSTAISLLQNKPTPSTQQPLDLQIIPYKKADATEPTDMATEYVTRRPWVFLPAVISTIKEDLMLQMLTIRHCVVERQDTAIAGYIALRLGLGEYFQRCVTENQKNREQDSLNKSNNGYTDDKVKASPTRPTPTSASPLSFSAWMEPRSDHYCPPFSWPAPATESESVEPDELSWGPVPKISSHDRKLQPPVPLRTTHSLLPVTRSLLSALPYYSLPSNTSVVVVDEVYQLPEVWNSLWQSKTVGMDSEWKPDTRPFNQNCHRVNGCRSTQLISKSSSARMTAVIQLACDSDDRIYIIDAVALRRDPEQRLAKILGNLFSHPAIRKIAYDWQRDKILLEKTFPLLKQSRNRLENFIDLRFIWFQFRYCIPKSTDPDINGKTYSHEHIIGVHTENRETDGNNIDDESKMNAPNIQLGRPIPVKIEAWSTLPQRPSCMSRYQNGGLSGMMSKLCGLRIDKTYQCSDWENRPLSEQQVAYAAIDVRCLLDIDDLLSNAERLE
ncbi:Exonuclease mut-7 [Mortierella sp. GBA30]|nr:Exonuclease mut-7 [Mortierella sp. GBA30]